MIRQVGALIAPLVAAIALAPQASAYTDDETEYLRALKGINVLVTVDNAAGLVNWGYRICGDLVGGTSPWAIARNTVLYGGASSLGVARLQVDAAAVWLCPQEINRVADSGV